FAGRLDDELGDLRDEVIYLKVKVRKEGRVSRSEYADLRDRLEDLRARARADLQPPPRPQPRPQPQYEPPPPPPPPPATMERGSYGRRVQVGQELDVRLQTRLNSAYAQV